MKAIKDEEMKEIEFSILCDVADFCKSHNLRYCLVCGTALGAIRHQGFIPWDDDIDIGMPRPDYEQFIRQYYSENNYVVDYHSGENYPYAFAKICDKATVLIEKITNPFPLGVYIDVFPIDGLPTDKKQQKKHLTRIDWDLRILSWKRISTEKKLDRIHKIIQAIAKICLLLVPVKTLVNRLNKDLKKYDYEKCEYVGHLASKSYWGNDLKPKKVFEPMVEHIFENRLFYVPGNYDEYLTIEYGNYKELPPEEKRIHHHDFTAYWKQQQLSQQT